MSSAKQGFYEGLKVLRPIFQDRTRVVGKQISAGLHVTTCGARAISGCRENEGPVEAAITLEVPLDSKPMIKVDRHPATPAVQGKAANDVAILRIESHVGVIQGNFYLGVILSERGRSKQQNNSQN